MDGITPEERARALTTVHGRMLEKLWETVLGRFSEPLEEADAIATELLEVLEEDLTLVRGRDAEVTQHFAIGEMESMWRRIKDRLAEDGEPLDIVLPG